MKTDWAIVLSCAVIVAINTIIRGTWGDHPLLTVITIIIVYLTCGLILWVRGQISSFNGQYWWALAGMSAIWISIGEMLQLKGAMIYFPAAVMIGTFVYFWLFRIPENKSTRS